MIKYTVDGANWCLSVSDNGVGLRKNDLGHLGLGTSIVEALAHQLDARVEVTSGSPGLVMSIVHAADVRLGQRASALATVHRSERMPGHYDEGGLA